MVAAEPLNATPRGFLEDEGLANSLRVISTAISRPA
jgi:hypothetical protein